MACSQWFQSARAVLSCSAQAVCRRASRGSSQRVRPSSSTPSSHAPSCSSLVTQPSSKALSSPCDQAKAPMGSAGLTSCIRPSRARSSAWVWCLSACMAMPLVMFVAVGMAMGFTVSMAMRLAVPLPCLRIGARFRVERGLVVYQGGAQAFGQFFQYVVGREAHPARFTIGRAVFGGQLFADGAAGAHLKSHMAVAQVIAQPRHGQAVFDVGGDHGFVCRADADDFAGSGFQAGAFAQYRTAVEEQADVITGVGSGPQAAALAQFVGQRQVVVDFAGVYQADSLCEFQHVGVLKTDDIAVPVAVRWRAHR